MHWEVSRKTSQGGGCLQGKEDIPSAPVPPLLYWDVYTSRCFGYATARYGMEAMLCFTSKPLGMFTHPPSEQKKKTSLPLALAEPTFGGSAGMFTPPGAKQCNGWDVYTSRALHCFAPGGYPARSSNAMLWVDACSLARLLACAAAAHPSLLVKQSMGRFFALAEPWQKQQCNALGGVKEDIPGGGGVCKAKKTSQVLLCLLYFTGMFTPPGALATPLQGMPLGMFTHPPSEQKKKTSLPLALAEPTFGGSAGMFTPPGAKQCNGRGVYTSRALHCFAPGGYPARSSNAMLWVYACSLARLLACAAAAHPSLLVKQSMGRFFALAEPWQKQQCNALGGVKEDIPGGGVSARQRRHPKCSCASFTLLGCLHLPVLWLRHCKVWYGGHALFHKQAFGDVYTPSFGAKKEDIPASCFGRADLRRQCWDVYTSRALHCFAPGGYPARSSNAMLWVDACSLARLLACAAAAHPSLLVKQSMGRFFALAEPWQKQQCNALGGVKEDIPGGGGSARQRRHPKCSCASFTLLGCLHLPVLWLRHCKVWYGGMSARQRRHTQSKAKKPGGVFEDIPPLLCWDVYTSQQSTGGMSSLPCRHPHCNALGSPPKEGNPKHRSMQSAAKEDK
ncbi:hypothetical protein HYFRA_00013600 [Hymenoscyphus fraxineus]|uniref:Uncharacterized protein n=1 Tax=Hymenoscyphus fraxineus TaxID=746836 RepID=A0A9N9LDV8_9HELO|nr:hypothetical protein HYFRA_00013600 [Hymenoscyphus fraxineus]